MARFNQLETTHTNVRPHVYALLVYVFLMPVGTGLEFGDISLMNYVALAYIALGFMDKRKFSISFGVHSASWIIYFGFSLLSLVWAGLFFNVNWFVYTFVLNMFLFIFISTDNYNEKEIKAIYKSILFSVLIIFFVTLLDFQSAMEYRLNIVLSRSIDMNDFGCGFILVLALLVYRFYMLNKRISSLALIGVLFFILLLTGSRGAMMAGASTILCGMVLYAKRKKNVLWTLIGLSAITVFFLLAQNFIPEYLLERFKISTILQDQGSNRIYIWNTAFQSMKDSTFFQVLFGHGFNTFGDVVAPAYGKYKMSHNIFVQTAVEIGLLGCLMLVTALFSAFRISLKSRIKFITPSLVGLIVASISLDMNVTRLFGLVIAFCFIQNRKEKAVMERIDLGARVRPCKDDTVG